MMILISNLILLRILLKIQNQTWNKRRKIILKKIIIKTIKKLKLKMIHKYLIKISTIAILNLKHMIKSKTQSNKKYKFKKNNMIILKNKLVIRN